MKLLAVDIKDIFGSISPPPALQKFIGDDPTGAGAISKFLSNGITLIYSIAAIVLLFMLLWGAFEWMTSGGDKEKLSSAQKRIMSAIIGIILFAVAFAVIAVLGQFTGFTFFAGQNKTPTYTEEIIKTGPGGGQPASAPFKPPTPTLPEGKPGHPHGCVTG